MSASSRRSWLKWVGLVFLAVVLAVGGLAARYASQRAEHQRLREAELTRAPVTPRRVTSAPLPTGAPPAVGCLHGVVLDHGQPVAGMQVSVSDTPPGVGADCPCPRPATLCGCRPGLAAVVANPRLGLVEAVQGVTTGADGRFELCGLTGTAPRLVWAEHADGRLAVPPPEQAPAVGPGTTVTLEVQALVPVQGVVLADHAPVAGAMVLGFSRPPLLSRRATTDARGRFSLQLPPGLAGFVVAAEGHPVQDFERGALTSLVVLELVAQSELEVRTVFEGKPVAGAEVTVQGEAPVLTGPDGVARLPLPAGEHVRVRATKGELLGSVSVAVLEKTARRLELALEKGVRVRGVVKDELGQPRQGKVRGFGGRTPLPTDDEGRFVSLPVSPRGELHPQATVEGCADSRYQTLTLEGREPPELTLEVACTPTVSGVVLDAEGQPIVGAFVTLDGLDHHESVASDEAGRFALHQPAGDYQLSVTHERYRRHEQPLQAPKKDLTVVLDAGGSVSGRVVNAKGQPVPEADVTVVPAVLDELLREVEGGPPARVMTDAEGRFEVNGVLAGRLVVSATADGLGTAVSDVLVLQPGEHREGVVVTFDDQVDVRGVVLDEQRRPIPGARVTWNPADEKSALMGVLGDVVRGRVDSVLKLFPSPAVSDAEGRFEIHNLPLSKVKLSVSLLGYANLEREASKGETVELVLRREGGVVRGRVVDEAGRPLARFEVNGATFTPDDGRFEVKSLSDELQVWVTAEGYTRRQVEAKVEQGKAEKDVGDVVMKKGLELAVEVVDGDGKPVAGARVAAAQKLDGDRCETKGDGRCVITPLAAVETEVKAAKEGFKPVSVTVAPADVSRPLRLTLLAAHGKLQGQVQGLGGRPLPSRTVFLSGEIDRGLLTDAQGRFSVDDVPEGPYCASLEIPGRRMFEWAAFAAVTAQPAQIVVGPLAGGARVTGSRTIPGRLVLIHGAPGPLDLGDLFNRSPSAFCETHRADAIVSVVTGDFELEGLPSGVWSMWFVPITQADEKGKAEPTVITLGPGELRRFD